jgi:hypothetical protein
MSYPVSGGNLVNFVGTKTWRDYEGTQFQNDVVSELLRKEGFERVGTGEVKKVEVQGNENVAEGDIWSEEGGQTVNGKRQRWFTRVSPGEVRHIFKGWEPQVQAIMNVSSSSLTFAFIDAEATLRGWKLQSLGPFTELENLTHSRMAE